MSKKQSIDAKLQSELDNMKEALNSKSGFKNTMSSGTYMMNLLGDYVGSGLAKLLKDWFEDHGDLSSKDIAELASIIIFADIKAGLQFYERKQAKTSQ